jgi:ABC-type multidrug transport system permease subunit
MTTLDSALAVFYIAADATRGFELPLAIVFSVVFFAIGFQLGGEWRERAYWRRVRS